eukprot:3921498-Amphidinium_carterae.1
MTVFGEIPFSSVLFCSLNIGTSLNTAAPLSTVSTRAVAKTSSDESTRMPAALTFWSASLLCITTRRST